MADEMIAGEWMTAEREVELRAALREHGTPCPNVAGLRCADFLSLLFGGLHNVRHASGFGALSRVDFSQSPFVELPIRCNLATTDGDTLTRIVQLAHALHIRAELDARGMSRIVLLLHPRQREGSRGVRHPSIADLARQCETLASAQAVTPPGE